MKRFLFIIFLISMCFTVYPVFSQDEETGNYTYYELRIFTPEEIEGLLDEIEAGNISEEEIENLKLLLVDKMLRGEMNNDEFGFMIRLMRMDSNRRVTDTVTDDE